MKNYAIIVAGGIGNRMNSSIPKQFLELAGMPIVMHSIQKFIESHFDFHIIVCLPKDQFDLWNYLCKKHNFIVPLELSVGGNSRFETVQNALELIKDEGIVAIHDAVRPFINRDLIKNGLELCLKSGNAIPSIELKDSIRKIHNSKSKSVNRKEYKLIQTPQFFQSTLIKKAYKNTYRESFTDDASVLEYYGEEINLYEGFAQNIKITYPQDLKIAQVLWQELKKNY